MKFIDLCFIPENAVQCFYGPIGTTLEQTDDGLRMVEPPEGMSWNTWKYKYAVNGGWPLLGDEAFEALFAEIPASDSGKLELSIVKNDVDTYVNKKIVEWFANGGVEEEWESYLNELNNMGVETYVSIYQEAYNRQK